MKTSPPLKELKQGTPEVSARSKSLRQILKTHTQFMHVSISQFVHSFLVAINRRDGDRFRGSRRNRRSDRDVNFARVQIKFSGT